MQWSDNLEEILQDPDDLSLFAFYWSRTLRFDRTNAAETWVINLYTHSEGGRARLDCVQLYTNAAFDSNLNSAPAVGSKNSNW